MIPRLHVITDDHILGWDNFIPRALGIMERGGGELVFHLRGPRTGGRALYALAAALKGPARTFGSVLLVNDRVDLALALQLPGAHLGQRSLPPEVAREILGPGCLLGLSVHSAEEAEEGVGRGAGEGHGRTAGEGAGQAAKGEAARTAEGGAGGAVDFLLVGTVFSSPSHPEGVPGGVGRIREVLRVCSLPLLSIGGISHARVGEVMASGAHGVAVRGGIWDAMDPWAAIEVYLEELVKGRRR